MDNTHWPTEDEQFEAYKYVLQQAKNKLIVIRTLDIGGDKKLSYFAFPSELNPFLGYRAIRVSLDKLDIFETQLRALGRASVYGKLAIMFPMIATIDEFIKAKEFTLKCFAKLRKEGVKVSKDIQIGMMVEIPSSAILADKFARIVDFFSIGTNDLVQYTFACDRMSPEVSYLYQPNNPSLLNLVKIVVEAAHKHKK
jgi:phosphotransferase system enzyme I (PtsI)